MARMSKYDRAVKFVCDPELYDTTNRNCLNTLLGSGLQPEHNVLDVGAGALGPGSLIMGYLTTGSYTALEPNKWLVEAATEKLNLKLTTPLCTFEDFVFSRIGKRFDYVFAHSIFTHADREQIDTILREAFAVLVDGGKLVASFYDQRYGDSEHTGWVYPGGIAYTREYIRARAESYGFTVDILVDTGHPSKHTWLVATKVKRPILQDEIEQYKNTTEYNKSIVERFVACVNSTPYLKEHRDFVEKHVYGFGDRSFQWLWKLIVESQDDEFKFLEIGVYKGQIISLIRMLANQFHKHAHIFGITPLSSFAGDTDRFSKFPETDYAQHIQDLHDHFHLEWNPVESLIVASSTDRDAIAKASELAPFDIVYIDGCHEYDYVISDIKNYAPLVRSGGLLVIDDSANFLNMPPGFFNGIEEVSRAVRDTIEKDSQWTHLLAVMHNRVFRKA